VLFPFVEKALASWKGSYDAIGQGGSSADVISWITGRAPLEHPISPGMGEKVLAMVRHAEQNHIPASMGTYPESEEAKYNGTQIYADHSYTVMGTVVQNGITYIKLRNPWDEIGPEPYLGHGIFLITPDKAAQLYQTFFTVADA
jgi:hypothetical protein